MHKHNPRKRDQRGLITMEVIIIIVIVAIMYFIYQRVKSAQQ
ncbi:MAG TPA: hypothetical protein PLT04_04420 [Candidatus Saccharibacteria bacterium]|nr:hypothetical protein [Candidatus Saccharibacteria bacterium]